MLINIIYLVECYICKIQHVGKSEIPFSIRLNNHRKNIKNPNASVACKHFNNHGFNNHGKFIITEQLRRNIKTPTDTLKEKQR